MPVKPAWSAHRNLRQLAQYRALSGALCDLSPPYCDVPAESGETPVGIYENELGAARDSLLLTDQAIYIRRRDMWERVRYADIVMVDWYGGEKRADIDALSVGLSNGTSVVVPVTGGDPSRGTRDAASVLTFLMRVSGRS